MFRKIQEKSANELIGQLYRKLNFLRNFIHSFILDIYSRFGLRLEMAT